MEWLKDMRHIRTRNPQAIVLHMHYSPRNALSIRAFNTDVPRFIREPYFVALSSTRARRAGSPSTISFASLLSKCSLRCDDSTRVLIVRRASATRSTGARCRGSRARGKPSQIVQLVYGSHRF